MYSTVRLASSRPRSFTHRPWCRLIGDLRPRPNSRPNSRPNIMRSGGGFVGLLIVAFGMLVAPQAVAQLPGETMDNAIFIEALPFEAAGNTCEHLHDYDEARPWESSAKDVVYAFAPENAMTIVVDLCGSSYDTKLFVYQDQATPGHPYACSDGYPACGYQSRIPDLAVLVGHTYYIVADGYVNDCGQYLLVVDEPPPCSIDCPDESILESEPDCAPGYVDAFNGGCSSHPVAFSVLTPSEDPIVVCGKTGNWSDGPVVMRDTDWYEIEPEEPAVITFLAVGGRARGR